MGRKEYLDNSDYNKRRNTRMHIYACDAESEPINFTNYTDGQLTPNFTLYEHCMQ